MWPVASITSVRTGPVERHDPVDHRGRDDHVVARADLQRAERRLDPSPAGLDVDAFVADRVAVERRRLVGHARTRSGSRRWPAGAAGRGSGRRRAQSSLWVWKCRGLSGRFATRDHGRRLELLGRHDRGRQVPVVEQRRVGARSPPGPSAPRRRGSRRAAGTGCGASAACRRRCGSTASHLPTYRLSAVKSCYPISGRARPIIGHSCPPSVASARFIARVNTACQRCSTAWSTTPRSSRPAARRCPTRSPRTASTAPPGMRTWSARCWCPRRRSARSVRGWLRDERTTRDRLHRRHRRWPVCRPRCAAADGRIASGRSRSPSPSAAKTRSPGLAQLARAARRLAVHRRSTPRSR